MQNERERGNGGSGTGTHESRHHYPPVLGQNDEEVTHVANIQIINIYCSHAFSLVSC